MQEKRCSSSFLFIYSGNLEELKFCKAAPLKACILKPWQVIIITGTICANHKHGSPRCKVFALRRET